MGEINKDEITKFRSIAILDNLTFWFPVPLFIILFLSLKTCNKIIPYV